MRRSLNIRLAPIALILLGCSQSIGDRAWYYVYLNHVSEYNTVTRATVGTLEQLGAEGDEIGMASNSLITLIDSIEGQLLRDAGQVDIRSQQTDDLPALDQLMSYEVSTTLMIGDEPYRPDTGSLSAYQLKMRIRDFVDRIASITGQDKGLYSATLNTDDIQQGQVLISWEAAGFYHLPLICVLDRLNDIKLKVRYVELQALACQTISLERRAKDEDPGGGVGMHGGLGIPCDPFTSAANPSGSNAFGAGPNANGCDPFGVMITPMSGDPHTTPEGSQPLASRSPAQLRP